MSLKLCTQIILVAAYISTIVYFLKSYHKIQQALQWWSSRQSIKLFLESENIRDSLLQESFIIRRRLDLLTVKNPNLLTPETQECLHRIDNFHDSLAELSDRLFPASLQDSLPLAIESLLKPWLISHPDLYFYIDMPASWRHEPAERSMIVLRALEELLITSIPKAITQTSIYITLKQQEKLTQLIVKISYPDVSTRIFYSQLPELNHLYKSFHILTGGKCFYRSQEFNTTWYFCW